MKTDKLRCGEIRESGAQCKAWSLLSTHDDDRGPRCYVHSKTPEQRSEMASEMARKSALRRRGQTEAKSRSQLQPGITLAEVLTILAPALEATDPFLPGEPLWPVRLAAAGTLLAAFPSYYRETPEKVNKCLRELLPDRVFDGTRHEAQQVYSAMRDAWDQLHGLRYSEIVGLYVAAYPGYAIAPWENAAEIQRSRPSAIPPDRAPVTHLPDGRVALERRRAAALLLPPPEEPDEADEVYSDAVAAF